MRSLLGCLAFVVCLSVDGQSAHSGEKIYAGRKWPAAQRVSIDKIDHRLFDSLLQKYVNQRGDVDYAAWKRSAADLKALASYLENLSQAEPRAAASRAAKLAYWINAYNALTLHGMLREYPTTSIRNHTSKLPFRYNIWKDLLLHAGGGAYSLEDIEHKILRKMGEPRIHFAIVCASRGCPRLLNRAYTARSLERQLSENTRDFFANRANFRYDAARGQMQLSSILKWFAEDFGKSRVEQLRTIAPWLPTPAAQHAARSGRVGVSYLDYDWSINQQR